MRNKIGSLEITVKNEVPSENFLMGTLFLKVNCRRTYGSLVHCTYFYWKPFFLASDSQKKVPLGSPGNNY
jgi:hypothetical protein